MTSDHKKEGYLVLEVRPNDEVWVGSVRIIIKDKNHIAVQAPKDLKIETIQPWRKRGQP